MRSLGLVGLAAATALLPVAADSVLAQGSSMSTGVAPAPRAGGWGSVPNVGLRPPAPTPAPAPAPRPGWGANGWNGGPPRATPGDLPPGGPVLPPPMGGGARPGRPDGPPPPGMHGRPGWNGGAHYGGGYRGGPGRFQRYGRGQVLPRAFIAPNLYIQDWWSYGLGRPGYGQNWLRYYDDALLVDGSGRVIDGRYGMAWDDRGPPPGDGYDDDDGDERGNYDHGWGRDRDHHRPPPPGPVVRHLPGGGTVVVRGGGWGGSTVVVVQTPPVVTTTTTTTYYDKVIVHRGRGHWKPKPRCRCK